MSIKFDYFLRIGASSDLNVDGSATSVEAVRGPTVNKIWYVHRMLVTIEDNSGFDTDEYGAIAKLTNGCVLEVHDADHNATHLLTDDPIQQNIDWGSYCYDIRYHDFGGNQVNRFLLVRWTFDRAGAPLFLDGGEGDHFAFWINDNLSALVKHKVLLQGIEYDVDEEDSRKDFYPW